MASQPPIPKNILVFGATGAIGKYIIEELYNARSSFEKIAFFTSKATAENKADEIKSWREKGVDVIVGDVTSEDDISKAYEGFDTVVSALGRNAILAQIPLVKLASASSSIHTFYPSEYGTDIEYGAKYPSEKPHQLKLQVRKYIRENAKDLNVTYLVTGPYSDMYFSPAAVDSVGSFNVKAKKATLLGSGDEKVSFTTMKDVGRTLVAALKTPAAGAERILKVNSFTVTPREALAEFEKQTGAKWEVKFTPLEELKRLETQAWDEDQPAKTAYTLRRIWTEGGTLYEKRSNGEIGFEGQEESLEEQVGKLIKRFG